MTGNDFKMHKTQHIIEPTITKKRKNSIDFLKKIFGKLP